LRRYTISLVHHGLLDGLIHCATNLGIAEAFRLGGQRLQRQRLWRKPRQPAANQFPCLLGAWQVVFQYVIETTEQRVVKDLRMVGRRDNQTVRLVVLDHLQEAVEHAANLAHIVCQATLRADGIEFVKEVHAAHMLIASNT